MKRATLFCLLILVPAVALAQITPADYERANKARTKFEGLAINMPQRANAIENTPRFWYRKSVTGGTEFVVVDAETLVKRPAFDHARLAAALNTATSEKYTDLKLPFTDLRFIEREQSIVVAAAGSDWTCDLSAYTCKKGAPAPQGSGRNANPYEEPLQEPAEFENEVYEGMFELPPQQGQGGQQQGGQQNAFQDARGLQVPGTTRPQSRAPKPSPDGNWEALIDNYNVAIRPKGGTVVTRLTSDGSEGNAYTLASLAWSPNSKYITGYAVRPGHRRLVHYVESAPTDQLQPKYWVRDYAKPGDALDVATPVLIEVATKKQTIVDDTLFPNPFSLSNSMWWKDSRAFTFEYNQRGHQTYRVIEVDAATGRARTLINEETKTFFAYRGTADGLGSSGYKKFRQDLNDGKEVVWMSERDGWNHLYLYDGVTGQVKNQITKGNWVVRLVDKVDDVKRQIWFQAMGMYPGKDPYLVHYYRINFDGTGLTALTEADGYHTVEFSSDMKYYVDTWSRVDVPPTSQLRRSEDQKVLMDLEKGDISALTAAGWRPPEIFTAKGRDGQTDIWGIIQRPLTFDPAKQYPVIENIYAGPQGSFVPKTFNVNLGANPLAELGFIIVQIDGMGTASRSKAFHDVAWKNLGDAGFPDRILWHKAVGAKYPYYDLNRVGITGGSAGGQNSTGGVLFHGDFYKVAISGAGCHDNRMDKIWWNEQWMGWPLGPHYAASSNVDNAHRLQGKLFLLVGELDTNVDPSSTMQVVNALIKARKKFDLLMIPGGGHGTGGTYTDRLRWDYWVHHLMGVEPPDWNKIEANSSGSSSAAGRVQQN
jgi:dipeptidyl aminopeptidase/acylaminoacyl peptidase